MLFVVCLPSATSTSASLLSPPPLSLVQLLPPFAAHPHRIVINKATNKAKGTAFVEYQRPECAAKAAAACDKGRRAEGPGVVLAGMSLQVDVAVDANAARQIAKDKAAGLEPADRRCLYLAKEGAIEEGSRAWQNMSEHDR